MEPHLSHSYSTLLFLLFNQYEQEDISNRVGGDGTKNSKKQSKGKETNNNSNNKATSKTKPIHMEDSQPMGLKAQKPRRLSARLQEIREREKENSSKSSCSNTAPQHVSRASSSSSSSVEESKAGPNIKQSKKRRQILKNILPTKQVKETKANTNTNSNTLKRQGKRRRTSELGRIVSGKSKRARIQDFAPIVMEEYIREDEDKYHVHPDFRLKRESFTGKDLTMGMAKHDRENRNDVLQAAPYVTDMFQHHFILEVGFFFIFLFCYSFHLQDSLCSTKITTFFTIKRGKHIHVHI